jgi:hypothetical protein
MVRDALGMRPATIRVEVFVDVEDKAGVGAIGLDVLVGLRSDY